MDFTFLIVAASFCVTLAHIYIYVRRLFTFLVFMDFTFLIVAGSFCVTLVYVKRIGLPTAVVTQ